MPGGSLEPWPGRGHPGRQCGGTHWGQTMCQFWVTAPSCHAGHNCSSSPQKHREEPQQYFIQGASGASRRGDTDLVCAASHGTRLVPGQLVWPQRQHPEVPQSPPQRRYPVAWSPPWHCRPPPLLPQLLVRSSPHMVPSLRTSQLFLRRSLAPTALLPGQQLC